MDVAARAGWEPESLALALLEGGARLIQLRGKSLPSDRFLTLCDAVVRAAKSYGARVIVNDRADLARLSGAAGVHVGQDDLPPSAVRRVLGPDAIVGYSTHTIEQIEQAAGEPVSYLAIGPVFGTRTKDTGYDAVGVDLVAAATRRSRGRPIVAIGGITLATAPEVWRAGASAVAIISDLLEGGDPSSRVASYNRLASAIPGLGG